MQVVNLTDAVWSQGQATEQQVKIAQNTLRVLSNNSWNSLGSRVPTTVGAAVTKLLCKGFSLQDAVRMLSYEVALVYGMTTALQLESIAGVRQLKTIWGIWDIPGGIQEEMFLPNL